MLPTLGTIRRLEQSSLSKFDFALTTGVVGLVGATISTASAAIYGASGALALLPDLVLGIGGPIAAVGGAALVSSQAMMRSGQRGTHETSDVVRSLDETVRSAIDGASAKRRIAATSASAGTLSTRRAIGRLPEIERRAQAAATSTATQAASLGTLVKNIQYESKARALHVASTTERDHAAAAHIADIHAQSLTDWTKVLDPGAPAIEAP